MDTYGILFITSILFAKLIDLDFNILKNDRGGLHKYGWYYSANSI